MTRTVYLIRHGQTDWNAAKRLQGQSETHMNDHGRSQVRRNASNLRRYMPAPERFDFVASPICRARETMEIVRRNLGLSEKGYRIDERLKEICYGDFEGHTWDELRESTPDCVEGRFNQPWSYAPPNGESYSELSDRVIDWLRDLSRDTVATAHAGVMRCVLAHFQETPGDEVPFLTAPQDRVLVIENDRLHWL